MLGRTMSLHSTPKFRFSTSRRIERPWHNWLLWSLATICRLHERQRQRQALRELDDRLLDDIGLSREQAEDHGNRPFWR
jgi:uncharacterized protein YjiS (DUF1127 family)